MTATPRRFAGRVALVTGGGSGIGRATALALAAEGARVVVAGRTSARLAETVAEARAAGGEAVAMTVDVTTEHGLTGVRELIARAVEQYGGLDIAVNNAGVPSWGLMAEMESSEWGQTVEVNLSGTWLCMKHELAQMVKQGQGAIVNVGSRIGVHMRASHQSAYAASKAAVSVLTRSAAREYIRHGVRINCVSPGPTETAMALWDDETPEQRDRRIAAEVPIGRMAAPAEIAAAILWLASPEAAFVVGHDLVIDGGISA